MLLIVVAVISSRPRHFACIIHSNSSPPHIRYIISKKKKKITAKGSVILYFSPRVIISFSFSPIHSLVHTLIYHKHTWIVTLLNLYMTLEFNQNIISKQSQLFFFFIFFFSLSFFYIFISNYYFFFLSF